MNRDQILKRISEAVGLKRQGKFEEARQIYENLDNSNPNNPIILKSWAKTLVCLRMYDLAGTYFMKAAIQFKKEFNEGSAWQCNDQFNTIQNRFEYPEDFKEYVFHTSGGIIKDAKLD